MAFNVEKRAMGSKRASHGGTTEIADGSGLSSLCRDFVLNQAATENMTDDHDSLFSTPEPDQEVSLGGGLGLPHEPDQATMTDIVEHGEGKQYDFQQSLFPSTESCVGSRAKMCSNPLIIDAHEDSTPLLLASQPTSPLPESMDSRSPSTWQVKMLDMGQVTLTPGQQRSPLTPTLDEAQDNRAIRSDVAIRRDDCESRVTSRGHSAEPSLWERPSGKDSLIFEGQQIRPVTALSKTTLALVDTSEHQSEWEPQQSAPQRMMAEPNALVRVSGKPPTRSLRPEVIIPLRNALSPSEQLSSPNGGRPAELESRPTRRKSSANQCHGPQEVRPSAGHKRRHFEEDDPLSRVSHRRRVNYCVDLVTGADVLSKLDEADVVGHSFEVTCDDWDLGEQASVAPASVQSFGELDDTLANSARARQGNAGKNAEHDLNTRRCSGKASTVGNDTTMKCDIPTGSMRMKVQQVMPADAAFVTTFVDDPVELRTLLESPTAWARSSGLSSTHTRLTNVTVSPANSYSWLVIATLSWIDGFAQGGRRYRTRSKRSCSPNVDAGSVHRSSEDEEDTRGTKRGHWTRKEDDNLREWKRIGRPWSWIFDQFPERTEAAVRSRWFVVLAPRKLSADTRT